MMIYIIWFLGAIALFTLIFSIVGLILDRKSVNLQCGDMTSLKE